MRWTKEEIELSSKMINEGNSFLDISKKLNRSHEAVTKKLNKLGFRSGYKPNNKKGQTKYSDYDWDVIQKKYDDGLSYEELISDLNLSARAIIWAKENDKLKLRTISEGLKLAWGKGKFKQSNKEGLERYRQLSEFKFNVYDYPTKFNLLLLEEYGWYKTKNRGDNPSGISRDHMYSVKDGFENDIDPYYISHPANCKLMKHGDNNKKNTSSSITLEELKKRVALWTKPLEKSHRWFESDYRLK